MGLILEKKQAGSHFIETKNRDSMPTVDRGKASHVTDPEKKLAAISSRQRIMIQ
jgi:hypothetical protein